jgi:hypothetical protein
MSRHLVRSFALAVAMPLATNLACAQGTSTLEGAWRSDGYGYAMSVRGDSLRVFEVTAVSCLPGLRAHRVADVAGSPAFQADGAPTVFLLRAGASADERRFHNEGAASDVVIRRAASIPDACERASASDAATSFDILWETYREHYPFFAAKHVDWSKVRDMYRPRAASATPEQLFGIFREMIEPLRDAHTFLLAPELQQRWFGSRVDPEPLTDAERARALEIVETKYLHTPLRTWANGRVSFGMLPDSIGYLRIRSFSTYVPDAGYAAWLDALDAALDAAFADTRGWRGLVIDVRVNGGGSDPLGLAIAARLTASPYTAYAKVARADPDDATRMTARQPSVVTPSTRPGWRGPVVELTSRYSVSAAETFTQALMGRRPAIARVGENTQGVFSDVLGRRLPNGWRFGLPNELFLDADGRSYDGPGIPPTVAVPTMMRADIAAGRDPALERAMGMLRGR